MKILGLLCVVLALAVGIVYVDGTTIPEDHSISVTGVVPAPPGRVFSLITNVANSSAWRPAVKSVVTLQPDKGRDHWVEYLDHGRFMTFLAVRTEAPMRREVVLDDPNASYGGTWIYELLPGPSPTNTTLRITETGFIHPPIYRFIMTHIVGLTHNLDQYMTDIKAAAANP